MIQYLGLLIAPFLDTFTQDGFKGMRIPRTSCVFFIGQFSADLKQALLLRVT